MKQFGLAARTGSSLFIIIKLLFFNPFFATLELTFETTKKDYKKQFTFTDASKNTIRAMIHFTLQIQKKTKVKLEKVVCTGDVEGNFSLWKLRKRSKPKLKQKNKLAQFIGSLLELPTTICVGTEGPILLLDKNVFPFILFFNF